MATSFTATPVHRYRHRILARYDGVLIADSVGLGKTWIGEKLLEDFAYHRRQRASARLFGLIRRYGRRSLAPPRLRPRSSAARS